MKNLAASASRLRTLAHCEWFLNTVKMSLITFSLMLFWFNLNNLQLVSPNDPLTGFSLRSVFWFTGTISFGVAVACHLLKSHFARLLLTIWIAVFFLLYCVGHWLISSLAIYGCIQYLSAMFGLSSQLLAALACVFLLYFLVGGLCFIGCFWLDKGKMALQEKGLASGESLKNICPTCGGHILFSAVNLGQTTFCPHCQASVTLRKQEELKMSCFFCKGHIKFPPHAIGEKISCPHCKMNITLKEPV